MRSKIKFVSLSLAVFLGTNIFIQKVFFKNHVPLPTKDRTPASIQRVYDYSDLQGHSLQMAIKDRFINSTEIRYAGNYVMIETGHFTMFDPQKRDKVFACGYYDKVIFEFEAQNVIVDGDKRPQLSVEGDCDIAANINYMTPIRLPLADLKASKPGNFERKFFDQDKTISVRFEHISSDWPTQWLLRSVRLTNSKIAGRSINIPTFEMGMGVRHQITMRW